MRGKEHLQMNTQYTVFTCFHQQSIQQWGFQRVLTLNVQYTIYSYDFVQISLEIFEVCIS